jgi:hypothetical protein
MFAGFALDLAVVPEFRAKHPLRPASPDQLTHWFGV